jgi:hypothetical protein
MQGVPRHDACDALQLPPNHAARALQGPRDRMGSAELTMSCAHASPVRSAAQPVGHGTPTCDCLRYGKEADALMFDCWHVCEAERVSMHVGAWKQCRAVSSGIASASACSHTAVLSVCISSASPQPGVDGAAMASQQTWQWQPAYPAPPLPWDA